MGPQCSQAILSHFPTQFALLSPWYDYFTVFHLSSNLQQFLSADKLLSYYSEKEAFRSDLSSFLPPHLPTCQHLYLSPIPLPLMKRINVRLLYPRPMPISVHWILSPTDHLTLCSCNDLPVSCFFHFPLSTGSFPYASQCAIIPAFKKYIQTSLMHILLQRSPIALLPS